ncbi:MAG TPA: four helix bundle protein, partial [Longimicrobium sp.]|nr:four helix bundle protein [Longimicrobium sp.]
VRSAKCESQRGKLMAVRRFEDLEVWRVAKDLALAVYKATEHGRFGRDFGLRDQIRKAAVSVMSNVAEGFDRYSRNEFRQFVAIARGSASEVRSQLHLARELGYLAQPEFDDMHERCWQLSRMLGTLRDKLSTPRK